MATMEMEHDVDPAQKIMENLGDYSGVELFGNQVLVAVYIRPQKTKSGIYITDKMVDEDRFQGKVGLLVAAGPQAFTASSDEWFENVEVNPGDWLVFRPSDGWSINVNGVLCRIMSDVQVKGRINSPDRVW